MVRNGAKFLVSFLTLLAISTSTKAVIQYGYRLGYTHSIITSQDQIMPARKLYSPVQDIYAPESKSMSGISGGVWFNTGDILYIQQELLVTTKGGKFVFNQRDGSTNYGSIYFTNLAMPTLVGVKFGVNRSFYFDLLAGPSFEYAFLRDAKFDHRVVATTHLMFDSYRTLYLNLETALVIHVKDYLRLDIRMSIPMHYTDYNYEQRLYAISVGLGYRLYTYKTNWFTSLH